MAHDPYRPPMSLQESEDLLRGHAKTEATKDAWVTVGWVALFLVIVGALVAILFFGLLGGAESAGPVALVLFLLFLPFILNKKK